MKTKAWRNGVFILLALCAAGASSLRAAPEPADPLAGKWFWWGDIAVTINADGTVTSEQGGQGTWTYLHNPEVQRHYRVIWEHGKSIDDIALAEDSQRGHVRNAKGVQFDIRRALSDQPATTAKGTPANEPVVGNWLWRGDVTVTLNADGTLTSGYGMKGNWTYLNNPEAERKYRLVWEQGKFIDEMVCSRDGQQAKVRNQKGERFDVRRALVDDKAAKPPGSTSR